MRREITLGLILMLLLSSLTIISNNVSAQIEKEDMVWSVGDKWEYRYTTQSNGMTMIFRLDIETESETTIEIDGESYDVFVADLDGEMETMNMGPESNITYINGSSSITGKLYADKNSDTTKTVQNMNYQLKEETTDTIINQTITSVVISRVISGEKPDVIDVGTNWVYTITTETTTTQTISGSFYDTLYGEPGYTNTTTTTINSTETTNYECLSKKTITTVAGTFETYEVKVSQVGQQGYTLRYSSTTVKDDVKYTTYDDEGNLVSLVELVSYDVASPDVPEPEPSGKTPGFELIIIICGIIIILFWKRKTV